MWLPDRIPGARIGGVSLKGKGKGKGRRVEETQEKNKETEEMQTQDKKPGDQKTKEATDTGGKTDETSVRDLFKMMMEEIRNINKPPEKEKKPSKRKSPGSEHNTTGSSETGTSTTMEGRDEVDKDSMVMNPDESRGGGAEAKSYERFEDWEAAREAPQQQEQMRVFRPNARRSAVEARWGRPEWFFAKSAFQQGGAGGVHLVEPHMAYGRAEVDWQGIHTRGYQGWLQEVVKPLEDPTCTARILTTIVDPNEIAVLAREEGDCIIVKGDPGSLEVLKQSLQPVQWELTNEMKMAWYDHVRKFAEWARLRRAMVTPSPDRETAKIAQERDNLKQEVLNLKQQMERLQQQDMVTPPPAQRTPTPCAPTKLQTDAQEDMQTSTSFVTAAKLLREDKKEEGTGWRKVTSKADDTPGSWSPLKTRRAEKTHKSKKVIKTKARKLTRAGADADEHDVDMGSDDDEDQNLHNIDLGGATQQWAPPEDSQA